MTRTSVRAARASVLALALALLAPRAEADTARYLVTFDAVWSAATHPTNFPAGPHFSPLVGGTHNGNVTFWQVGGIATNGIEMMAEVGASTPLLLEIQTEISVGDAFDTITGPGLGPSPGSVSAFFDITSTHPLVTLVSMVAPSPDWFVGVSGASLRPGGTWVTQLVVDLDPYDAGTDSGASYEDPDDDTDPQDAISQITGFPFTGTGPLGTFTFDFISVLPECEDGVDNDLDGFTDFGSDPGCDSNSDPSEKSNALICDDGIDNDFDSLIDFPLDPDCTSILGTTEGDPPSPPSLPALSFGGLALLGVVSAGLGHVTIRRRARVRVRTGRTA